MLFLNSLLNRLIKLGSSNLQQTALYNSTKTDQTDFCCIWPVVQSGCRLQDITPREDRRAGSGRLVQEFQYRDVYKRQILQHSFRAWQFKVINIPLHRHLQRTCQRLEDALYLMTVSYTHLSDQPET